MADARRASMSGRARIGVLAVLLGGMACADEHTVTGIRLTVRYDTTPAWLHISGASDSGDFYGPTLLPDPPRPLESHRETVMLLLAPEMHGRAMSLRVVGLSSRRAAETYGSVQTEIAAGRIQSAVVWLTSRPECREGSERPTHLCGHGDGPPLSSGDASAPDVPDAGLDASGGVPICADASCMDASSAVADAALEEPPPEEEPPLEEEPPPSEPCEDGSCVAPNQCSAATCEMKCSDHARCEYDCGEAEYCDSRCDNATCLTDCSSADRCRASCAGQADCEIVCGPGTDCADIKCQGASRCLLRCNDGACELRCSERRKLRDCGGGVYACNRECPS